MVKVYRITMYTDVLEELEELRIDQVGKNNGCRFLQDGSNTVTYLPRDHKKFGRLVDELSMHITAVDVIHVYSTEIDQVELDQYYTGI